VYTGSLYDDSSLTRKGMYGEGVAFDAGLTLLQKSHGFTTGEAMKMPRPQQEEHNHLAELGCRGVVVVRNPFKALISHRHLDIGGHTGYAPKSQFLGAGWADFVKIKTRLWLDFYRDWITKCPEEKVFITHYELLKSNLKTELREILHFLKVPINEERLSCVQSHSDGLFKRKPSKHAPYDIGYYPRELKQLVYGAIRSLDQVLVAKGKRGLPLDAYELYDPAEEKIILDELNRHNNTQVEKLTSEKLN